MISRLCLLSSLYLTLVGCSTNMASEFDCNVPNNGVCQSLTRVNHLVDAGFFDDELPQPLSNQ